MVALAHGKAVAPMARPGPCDFRAAIRAGSGIRVVSSPIRLRAAGSAGTAEQVQAFADAYRSGRRRTRAYRPHRFDGRPASRKARRTADRKIFRPFPPSTFGPFGDLPPTATARSRRFGLRYYVYQSFPAAGKPFSLQSELFRRAGIGVPPTECAELRRLAGTCCAAFSSLARGRGAMSRIPGRPEPEQRPCRGALRSRAESHGHEHSGARRRRPALTVFRPSD